MISKILTILPMRPTLDPALRLEVVFIDGGVDDAETLLDGLRGNREDHTQWLVLELSADEDGIDQITHALSKLSGVDAVHILSHGDGEGIQLGNTRLDVDTAAGYAGEIASWANSLDADADLLIYGCDLASTASGRDLIDSVGALCDCDVAASDDATGHGSLGGDWELEYRVGSVDLNSVIDSPLWYSLLSESTTTADATLQADSSEVPLAFEENLGQTDDSVDFLARGSGYTVFLTDGDAVLSLAGSAVLTLDVVSDQTPSAVSGVDELITETHYLFGDQSNWIQNVDNFAAVEYEKIYDGIDVRYYGFGRQLEYDFIVDAGADASQITMRFDGAESVTISESGELVINLVGSDQTIHFRAPFSYQESAGGGRDSIESRYIIRGDGSVGFALGDYDPSRQLVIDPILDYGSYLGGLGTETAEAIAVDTSGNAYITGGTTSSDFPATTGPFGTTGGDDVFVTKLGADGSTVLYTTYFGGSGNDVGYDIDIDASGNAYVVGKTSSADFNTTTGAYDETLDGASDGFVVKLNSTGSSIDYGSYIGSNLSNDAAHGVAVDGSGQAHVTGVLTGSIAGFPTSGAYQTTFGGGRDAFLAVFSADGSAITYGSYFGGSGAEDASAIAIDDTGAAYLTGSTNGTDLPVTGNAYQSTSGGGVDAFVAKLNPLGGGASDLLYSTYLGGSMAEQAKSIAVGAGGRAYIVGLAFSSDFDTTVGAYDTTFSGTDDEGFLAVLDTSLSGASSLAYSTALGGNGADDATSVAVDSFGVAWITGTTLSGTFPTTADAHDAVKSGTSDAFITAIDPSGNGAADLVYSTFLGGTGNEDGNDIAIDSANNIYVVGETLSANFDTTTGAYDETLAGSSDGFVAKFLNTQLVVDTTNDVVDGATTSIGALLSNRGADGKISLREAILAANSDTAIAARISLDAGVYALTGAAAEDAGVSGDLDISDNVTIVGAGVGLTFIDGGAIDRVFDVHSGTVTFSDMTIQNGLVGAGYHGGGIAIASGANVTIDTAVLTGNVATGGSNYGGGVYNAGDCDDR